MSTILYYVLLLFRYLLITQKSSTDFTYKVETRAYVKYLETVGISVAYRIRGRILGICMK